MCVCVRVVYVHLANGWNNFRLLTMLPAFIKFLLLPLSINHAALFISHQHLPSSASIFFSLSIKSHENCNTAMYKSVRCGTAMVLSNFDTQKFAHSPLKMVYRIQSIDIDSISLIRKHFPPQSSQNRINSGIYFGGECVCFCALHV